MKKTLFLLPVLLIVINFTHLSIFKDKVNYNLNEQSSGSLTPSYWHQESLVPSSKANSSIIPPTIIVGSGGVAPVTQSISKGAAFHGFPFGFYLKNPSTVIAAAPSKVTAFAWRWAIVDGVIVLASLALAVAYNFPRHRLKNKKLQTAPKAKVIVGKAD